MAAEQPKLLFIDDEKNFRDVTAFSLAHDGYDVATAANGREGLDALDVRRPDLVLCDLQMPVLDGMGFLAELAQRDDPPPAIVLTAFGSIDTAVEAMRAGAVDYITKPINRDALRMAIGRVLDHQRLKRENEILRRQVAEEPAAQRLLGDSPAMQALRETLGGLAESDAPVLLRGESGVGKELAARALHFDGPRAAQGQFVVLNCAAIPADLLESELFGHRKGSFTGADRDQVGKFEAAHGGTLFLDEIGDMPLNLQAKLLRALQEGEITPVGESAPRRVDVRIVSATNQLLEERIAASGFRQDLYYRLAVVPLEIAPLRARREDVMPLARHFLGSYGSQAVDITEGARERLEKHDWPGNVRELANVIMRACALRPGLKALEAEDVAPAASVGRPAQDALLGSAPLRLPPEGLRFDDVERRLLEAAWEQSGHNQSQGAELLGLPRQAFIYRLQKHGLIPEYGARGKESPS